MRAGSLLAALLGVAFVALVVSEAALLVTSARRRRRVAAAVEHAAVVAVASVVPIARPTPADTYTAARAEARTAHLADVVGEACHLTELHDRCGLTMARQARLAALRDDARARGVDLPALGLPGGRGGQMAVQAATKVARYLWCHECRTWGATVRDVHGGYTCDVCGEDILCDECGQPWADGHEHAGGAA